jgi:hypothetical protein
MRFFILSAFCSVAMFPGLAEGRIGWTHEQCVQFWGEPVMQVATSLVKSEGEADVFKATLYEYPILVRVEYRAGKVWMITYEGRGMRKNVAPKLVAKNAGKHVRERSFLRVQHWIEKEKGIHAVYFVSPVQRLIVMNAKSLTAEKKPGVSLILDPGVSTGDPGTPEDPEGEKKPAPVTDPLDKF